MIYGFHSKASVIYHLNFNAVFKQCGSFHCAPLYRPDYWFAMGRVSTRSITCDCETISAGRAERKWSNFCCSSSMPLRRNLDSANVNQALGLVVQNRASLMSRGCGGWSSGRGIIARSTFAIVQALGVTTVTILK